MNKIYQKMYPENKSRPKGVLSGFTLIELLVVVLIVGLLAAMAFAKYEMAVAQARAVEILPLLDSVRKAQDIYFLTHGSYSNTWQALGVDIEGVQNVEDCHTTGIDTQCFSFKGYRCQMNSGGGSATCSGGKSTLPALSVNFTGSGNYKRYGARLCAAPANNEESNRICQALGGILKDGGSSYNYYSL